MSEEKKNIIVEEISTNKNIVKDMLNNICVHEWIEDYIDICPETSQKICYCVKCEVTKT
jgi:hypothetical protein